MGMLAANSAGVLVALVLLGVEVRVVAIAVLAYVSSREIITVRVLVRAGTVISASAIAYVIAVILVGILVSP